MRADADGGVGVEFDEHDGAAAVAWGRGRLHDTDAVSAAAEQRRHCRGARGNRGGARVELRDGGHWIWIPGVGGKRRAGEPWTGVRGGDLPGWVHLDLSAAALVEAARRGSSPA